MFSVSGAVPDALEYLTVMVQEPPGAMATDVHVSVSEKALPAPCANVSDVMVRPRLPVFVTGVVGLPDEWVAGTMRTRGPPSVTYMSPLGSNAKPVGALNAHGVTETSQGAMATLDVPVPLSPTCRT